jgi:Reverse transcriptase (RNA-dependent DNA polymerase)
LQLKCYILLKGKKCLLFKIDFEKPFDRVNWDFLFEILEGKGFSSLWISWIKNILYNSKTCINFNGQLGEYFSCKRGVRQGDLISPFLFYLVSDVLHSILAKTQHNGHLKGIGSFSYVGNIHNLHFADDTLLFLEASDVNIQTLKWLLLSYEDFSGMKVTFNKYKLVPLNLTDNEGTVFAEQLGCKLFSLPLMYLGMSLHWKKLSVDS